VEINLKLTEDLERRVAEFDKGDEEIKRRFCKKEQKPSFK